MSRNISPSKALNPAQLRDVAQRFREDRTNRVAANAAVANGVLKAATSYRGIRALPRDFSIELKQGGITDQERSGRCWEFAALNTLRYELMHTWGLEDFEFSESYLFFWDKIEKANTYLEHVIETADQPVDSRLFSVLNEEPVDDGGWWQMFAQLVNKYGLVPKSAYPESANSRNSSALTHYLNIKLREFAAEIRDAFAAGKSTEDLRALKQTDMETVYRIVAISLGEPPTTFDFLARKKDDDKDKDKDNKDSVSGAHPTANDQNAADDSEQSTQTTQSEQSEPDNNGLDKRPQIIEHNITPLDFYHKYVPVDVNDFLTLSNAPMKRTPLHKHYQIAYTTNVAEAADMEFINVGLDEFRKAVLDQLKAGHPVWFACDCDQYSLSKEGFFDPDVVRVDELFGIEFTFDKGASLEYGQIPSNHAMTLTGVNLDADGNPTRWKVENSWGKDFGKDGYFVASNAWFDRYVTEVIINKQYVTPATAALIDAEPVVLQPWEPLTRPCR